MGDENEEVVSLLDTGQVGTLPLPSEQCQLVVHIAKFSLIFLTEIT
jgi:hypothetical protein